jgi:glycosyltransferase involved in cell wall biosynthesis
MSEKNKVSIIIPCYNRQNTLPDALNSIVNQLYHSWEVHIIDDGSSDESLKIIQDYGLIDRRIKIGSRFRDPKGAPTCRNIGVEQAKGEYVIFLDSDDLLAPWCLKERVAFMGQNPDLDFAIFPILKFKKQIGDTNELWNSTDKSDDLEGFLKLDIPWQTTSPIWRKESLLKLGKWNEDLLSWQDWEFHIRAIAEGLVYKKAMTFPDSFIRRDEGDRISKKDSSVEQIMNRRILFREIYLYLKGKSNITQQQLRYIGRLYFIYTERIIIRKLSYNPFEFYEDVQHLKILPSFYFYISWVYLKLLQFFMNKNLSLLARIINKAFKIVFPRYFKAENTLLFKHKMSDTDFAELRQQLNFENGK